MQKKNKRKFINYNEDNKNNEIINQNKKIKSDKSVSILINKIQIDNSLLILYGLI